MDISSPSSFGAILRRFRVQAGLTQEKLAEVADLSPRTVSDLERGVNQMPRPDTAQLLAGALGLAADERRQFLAACRPALPAPVAELPATERRYATLPAPLTLFIGRTEELQTLTTLLGAPEVRLITLTGPAGVGKTRLAWKVAEQLLGACRHGVVFVPLAAVTTPELVISSIAQALGVREGSGQPLRESVQQHLSDLELLLVLDNFEQVLVAAPLVSEILAAAPGVKSLVTSRAVLHLQGEREIAVRPLRLPERAAALDLAGLTEYEAVALFVKRACDAQPDFRLTAENGPVVVEICRRLDGLPLAIELAAPRIKILPPPALLAWLDKRLPLLVGGARDLPARHQTLRDAFAWSYDLLGAAEQTLFCQLAVFVGGCSLDAAAAIRDRAAGPELIEELTALVDQSLLRQRESAGAPRFGMLETIQEYALERLEESGSAETSRERHARFYLALAERAEVALQGSDQCLWLDRLEEDHDNFRAALQWALTGAHAAGADLALRLAVALWRFWYIHGYLSEGRRWLEAALARNQEAASPLRMTALRRAGVLANDQGDYRAAGTLYEESLALARRLGQAEGIAASLSSLGVLATNHGDCGRAKALLDESLALRQQLGDIRGIAGALDNLGNLALDQGGYEEARRLYEDSLALFRELGDRHHTATLLNNLGQVARHQSEFAAARALHAQALEIKRELGDKEGIASSLTSLGHIARLTGDYEEAGRLYAESLALFQEVGDRAAGGTALSYLGQLACGQGDHPMAARLLAQGLRMLQMVGDTRGIARCLSGLAAVVLAVDAEAGGRRAARLLGAAAALSDTIGTPLDPLDRTELEHASAAARSRLSDAGFAEAWAAGQSLLLAQAIGEALAAQS